MRVRTKLLSLVFSVVALLSAAGVSYGDGYVIGEEDRIQISVWGNPELTVTVPVKPDGMISMHLVGDVKAAGLTTQELKAQIEKALSKYMKEPNVSVIVTDVNSFKVFVLGDGVGAQPAALGGQGPLVFTFRRNTSLMQLLAYLGSLRNADLNGSYILRGGKKLDCDFFKLVERGDLTQDVQLRPDDTVVIPDNFEKRITVVGAVKTPNVQNYREGQTVVDAVLAAGGFTEYASPNDVIVVRKENGKFKTIEVRLKDVMQSGEIEKDLPLMPGDHVIVKTGIF